MLIYRFSLNSFFIAVIPFLFDVLMMRGTSSIQCWRNLAQVPGPNILSVSATTFKNQPEVNDRVTVWQKKFKTFTWIGFVKNGHFFSTRSRISNCVDLNSALRHSNVKSMRFLMVTSSQSFLLYCLTSSATCISYESMSSPTGRYHINIE